MESFHNLYIIGTSHISRQSIAEINQVFKLLDPDIIAVELDMARANALLSEKQGKPSFMDIGKVGFKGFLFALFGSWASSKLGKLVGVKPGSEMKTAILLGKKHNKKVALIDQDIRITLKRFSKAFTWKERWNFIVDLFKGVILRKKDPLLNFDLNKVPEKKVISMLIGKVKERYPNLHKVIIDERNYFMARRLKKIIKDNPEKKIMAVVGAGHEEDILSILKENDGVSYSYSYSVAQ